MASASAKVRRRAVQAQGEERKGYERRIKDLEMRLNSVMSAKARDDEEHASRVKVLMYPNLLLICNPKQPHHRVGHTMCFWDAR